MIPDAAVEAAEAVLLGYTGGCACHEAYSGRNLIDPECSYHDVPPEVARLILEAAAPHMGRHATSLDDAPTSDGTVVMIPRGKVVVRRHGRWEFADSVVAVDDIMEHWLPVTVLYEPNPHRSQA